MKVSFWSLNIGLAWMLFVNLVPIGMHPALRQLPERLLARPRSPSSSSAAAVRVLEWLRLPGDVLFIVGGILPVVYLAVRMFLARRRYRDLPEEAATEVFTEAAPG